MVIPIQNIYYLLCYAWNILDEQEPTYLTGIPGERVIDLLTYLLKKQATLLLKKGVARQYVRETQVIKGIKGKLEIEASVRADLFRQGKATCTFETLSTNILPNQIIKATLYKLLKSEDLNAEWKSALKTINQALKEVDLINISSEDFKNINYKYLKNPYYKQVLAICELLWHNLLPEADGETFYFTNFLEDERQMARLFEAFVRNFYKREQVTFQVKSEKISWVVDDPAGAALHYLPQMLTDISLLSANQNIIMDTKYYKAALLQRYDKQKLISGHLYQLFAYLKNRKNNPTVQKTEGVLLYPVVQHELDLTYQMQGHQVSIKTINLAQPWQNIKQDLLALIEE